MPMNPIYSQTEIIQKFGRPENLTLWNLGYHPSEFGFLLEKYQAIGAKHVLHIGGNTTALWYWKQLGHPNIKIWLFEPDRNPVTDANDKNTERITTLGDPVFYNQMLKTYGQLDFLCINIAEDEEPEEVATLLRWYGEMVGPGGVIAIHSIHEGSTGADIWKLVEETGYQTEKFEGVGLVVVDAKGFYRLGKRPLLLDEDGDAIPPSRVMAKLSRVTEALAQIQIPDSYKPKPEEPEIHRRVPRAQRRRGK